MKDLFVDCPTGLAGDMLLGALLDLGVPKKIIEMPLLSIDLRNSYDLKIEERNSGSLRGLRVCVDGLEEFPPNRCWNDIKKLILEAPMEKSLQGKVFSVFEAIAEAEAIAHGTSTESVHFHEVGAIDALVDVIGVCASIEYLKPNQIICAPPPAGSGSVKTSHGFLPVPVPAVVEIAKRYQIQLLGEQGPLKGELTTPTGLALMAVLADRFGYPSSFGISDIGVGLGHRTLDRPNLVRIFSLHSSENEVPNKSNDCIHWEPLVSQEVWIDDATSEDLAALIELLRSSGAIEVTCQTVQMKKGRQGFSLTAIVKPENASVLRLVWLSHCSTLGVRERLEGRWVLPRRIGYFESKLGKVVAKQVKRPNGNISVKFEHDDLIRLSLKTGLSLEEVRKEVLLSTSDFYSEQEWTF